MDTETALLTFSPCLRVRADHGVENAHLMFSVQGTGRSSYTAGLKDCGEMCSQQLQAASMMSCTSLKRKGILTYPTVYTCFAAIMPLSHSFKLIWMYSGMGGIAIPFLQGEIAHQISCCI
ncbi:hypothetical protein NQD34_015950 [Periophthalmus magnuspinnatus]|nr:hypothetical protein NQD34_015950 [Periophthalmus magnuspinnatus]